MFKKLGNDVVLPVMDSIGFFVKQHSFTVNNFIKENFSNRILDSNDRFLIDRVLISDPCSYKKFTEFSDLAKYTNSEEVDASP